MHPLRGFNLVGLLAGATFASGLNVYAAVATLGLLGRSGVVALPPSLHVIETWWIIVPCVLLFGLEFFADKVPLFDLLWNALHTFVRVPIAALLAYGASANLSPEMKLLAAALGGAVALAAHGGKLAVRTAVTPTPEPLSNIALSAGEDGLAVGLTWMATRHPYWSAIIVLVLLVIALILVRAIVRALRRFLGEARQVILGPKPTA